MEKKTISMYALLDNYRILLGVFSSKEKLNMAIKVIKLNHPDEHRFYYQEFEVDTFDSTLMQFFTMHPEKFITIDAEKEKEFYI